jgi:hypothetical protein
MFAVVAHFANQRRVSQSTVEKVITKNRRSKATSQNKFH